MKGQQTDTNRGKPGAFAPDVTRVTDEPVPVNYRSGNPIGGNYRAKCRSCGSWHRAYDKADAISDAVRCCGGEHGANSSC